ERFPLDQLHHQRAPVRRTVEGLEAENLRDAAVAERGERLRFALEPREAIGIGGDGIGQDLDRHVAIELRVARAIDLAHAAGAEWGDDFVRADARAGSEGHWLCCGL